MKIINTNGEVLERNPLDFTKGRLLQSVDDPETYVFTTYAEVPRGEGIGETENEDNN